MVLKKTEDTFIGSLLLDERKLIDVIGVIKPEYFTTDNARTVFVEMERQFRDGVYVDVNSIALAKPDFLRYLSSTVTDAAPFLVKEYGNRIRTLAQERRLDERLKSIQCSRFCADEKLGAILELYNDEIIDDVKTYDAKTIMDRFSSSKRKPGIRTGIQGLQDLHIEYRPGHIWLLGAYTSVGKTAVMVQKICNLLLDPPGGKILIVSTEMTEEQMIGRILANLSGIPSYKIMNDNLFPQEEEHLDNFKRVIAESNLVVCDDIYEVSDIEKMFRRESLTGKVDLGFIDYVQNCTMSDAVNEYQAESKKAKRFQKMAKDNLCNLVCLSQVSNDVGRGNTDQLEFKGAGEWAAVADVGVLLQRNKDADRALKYSVKKNRHGAKGDVYMEYSPDFTRIKEVEGVLA